MMNFFKGTLVCEQMDSTGGRSTGFDYLRFSLAVSVILYHTVVTSYGDDAQTHLIHSEFGFLVGAILPMFFSLSGFLVAGSLMRSKTIGVFLGFRILRIFPALAVDTLFCALILGPLLTTIALHDYFFHSEFRSYFLNMIGDIHYTLPGVFVNTPCHLVNGQLWTIPIELECYITLTVLALFSFHHHRRIMLVACSIFLVALEGRVLLGLTSPWAGRTLLLCFLCGVVCFLFRDKVRLSIPLFGVAIIASYFCLQFKSLTYLSSLPLTYVTVYLGLLNPKKSKFLNSGDYSYGLFLYGFPLQQALVTLVPAIREWYWNAALAIPVALAFSVGSWHLVEKRVLARKPLLSDLLTRMETLIKSSINALFPAI
ncbi:MAG TPA: acyltransferase [Terracidiphilus sp.]|jgi:peptidoglycan/LPS O-acetylase OafA/YrhL